MKLRVGYLKAGTRALGPGNRFVIWTQGCLRKCKGCASPELQALDSGYWLDTKELSDQICSCLSIDGITISGGEPFLQAEALSDLLYKVSKVRPELTVIVFTGNKMEELTDLDSKTLLGKIDLLIDGEYIPDFNDGKGLRGSSNQILHFLSDSLTDYRNILECGERKTETYWVDDRRQRMVTIGVPRSNRVHS